MLHRDRNSKTEENQIFLVVSIRRLSFFPFAKNREKGEDVAEGPIQSPLGSVAREEEEQTIVAFFFSSSSFAVL